MGVMQRCGSRVVGPKDLDAWVRSAASTGSVGLRVSMRDESPAISLSACRPLRSQIRNRCGLGLQHACKALLPQLKAAPLLAEI